MAPPTATAVSNPGLDSLVTSKKVASNSNAIINNINNRIISTNVRNSNLTAFYNKTMSIATNSTLFDTISIEKSHANQALVDLYKLFDLNGTQHLVKSSDNSNNESINVVNEGLNNELSNFNDDLTSKRKRNISENKSIDDGIEVEFLENDKINNSIEFYGSLKFEKKQDNGRKLKENILHQSLKGTFNNEIIVSNISTNANNISYCDISKKPVSLKDYNINSDNNRTNSLTKSKFKFKTDITTKSKNKQNDNINENGSKIIGKINENTSVNSKSNILTTNYCKIDNSAMRSTNFKTSIMDNENFVSLHCINPVQIFPYKLTLKRIKTEISDSEEEIDVVSVNLNKNTNNNFSNCNNKICLQDTSNNIIIIKKSGLKSNYFPTQSQSENPEVQMIKSELINNNDKSSLLADILKTPMSFSSKSITPVSKPSLVQEINDSCSSSINKKALSSAMTATNKMKYPIQFYSSIKDTNYTKESYKSKIISNKFLKSNIVNLNQHKRNIRNSNGMISNVSNSSVYVNSSSKKTILNNVIQKANKKNTLARKPTSLIITQRSLKVESLKTLWKNKRLKRKINNTKFFNKKNSNNPFITDSEESSNEDIEDELDSTSSTLSNFSSTHSSGWSSPVGYSSSSESVDKSSNIMSPFDLNVLNEKLSKKANSEKADVSDWSIFSNINDYPYSETSSSLCSEQINCSSVDNSNNISNGNSNSNLNNQSNGYSLKRNRSYTSGYSSDNPAEKRAFHILSERQRRNDLKKLFETLRTNVPNLSDKQKASKLTILKAAVDFLADVTTKQTKLHTIYEKEKQRNLQLIHSLKVLQANMK